MGCSNNKAFIKSKQHGSWNGKGWKMNEHIKNFKKRIFTVYIEEEESLRRRRLEKGVTSQISPHPNPF